MAATAKPRFGDLVENGWASEENPTRRGFFVREGKRTGRMNAGTYWEITDGKGKFWECPLGADHKLTWAPTARPTSDKEEEAPVAWLMRQTNGVHDYACITPCAQNYIDDGTFTKEPLYARPSPGVSREEVARLIYFIHGEDLTAERAMDPTNDDHWMHWRDVEPEGTRTAFETADSILALLSRGEA